MKIKELIHDNYIYCPYGKYIPKFILKKFNLLMVGVFLLNLNNDYVIEDKGKYYTLYFMKGSCGRFHLDKNKYRIIYATK